MSRRSLLAGAAAVGAAAALAGCASRPSSAAGGAAPSTGPAPPSGLTIGPTADADRDVAMAAIRDEGHALALYLGLADVHPGDGARLRPLVAVQRKHVDALAAALDSTSSPPHHTTVAGPPDRAVVAEARRQAARRIADCQAVESGSLASLFASMAAAHHVIAVIALEWGS